MDADSLTHTDWISTHPQGSRLSAIFAEPRPADFKSTGVMRADYLKLIAANVDYFKCFQDGNGAVIDPVSGGERQYSTPAFALAAGMVAAAGRDDLRRPAEKALSHSLNALLTKRCADGHSDFYVPMVVHAFRALKEMATPEWIAEWEGQFHKIDPETMFVQYLRHMNWNVVSSSGELLRRRSGLVAIDQRDRQMAYLESCLSVHTKGFTPLGMFEDPGAPMAYDAFSRLWLEDVFADNAYDGEHALLIERGLRLGGLSTLLMLSPTGEWPTGGRSSMHNWTDAQIVTIAEINAAYWKGRGRDDVAGAFKRASHLAFKSMARWQRPTGELNIIKNRADADTRFAYEAYSNHSQYNLLPMAMLAIAHVRADDTIAERPSPSEAGGYVFDVRETFHKIFAAAGGYYVEIDTAADAHYNATGLQRVHKAGIDWPMLTDSCPPNRVYGDPTSPRTGLALGIAWPSRTRPGEMRTLADFARDGDRIVMSADLQLLASTADSVAFLLTYRLAEEGDPEQRLTERYTINAEGVRIEFAVNGVNSGLEIRIPVLLSDGKDDFEPVLSANRVQQAFDGSITTVMGEPVGNDGFVLRGDCVINHSGVVQSAAASIILDRCIVRVTLTKHLSSDEIQQTDTILALPGAIPQIR